MRASVTRIALPIFDRCTKTCRPSISSSEIPQIRFSRRRRTASPMANWIGGIGFERNGEVARFPRGRDPAIQRHCIGDAFVTVVIDRPEDGGAIHLRAGTALGFGRRQQRFRRGNR